MRDIIRILVGLLIMSTTYSFAQSDGYHNNSGSPDHIMLKPGDLKWVDAPPGLPAGAKVAVLEGDPSKEGPYTIRLKMPANYKIKPHWHPGIEHVSVISGELYMGLGETFDESKASAIPPEGFAVMQIGTRHFAFTKNRETILQLHGMGPWGITYVNPADDPRKLKSSN